MDAVRPDLAPLMRVTAAVLELGQRVAAGDKDAAAEAAVLAELLTHAGQGPGVQVLPLDLSHRE